MNNESLGFFGTLSLVVFLSILLYLGRVTESGAVQKIKELESADVVVVMNDSGNDIPLLQTISDVTFEVIVVKDGQERLMTARCTNGLFQNLACQVFD